MPTRSEVAYFGAGPAPLPTPVIESSAQAFVNFDNTGLSLAEISHRSPTANKILADAKEALTKLYNIPDDYDIFFMQAGGTGEFSAACQNLVGCWIEQRRRKAVADIGEGKDDEVLDRVKKEIENELKVDYLVTGSWSLKASQEATRLLGAKYVNVALDARKSNNGKFGKIPDESEWKLTPKSSAFTYMCDNETVDGVEFPSFPKSLEDDDRIVVADMSSNFVSKKLDISKYGVIFVSILLAVLDSAYTFRAAHRRISVSQVSRWSSSGNPYSVWSRRQRSCMNCRASSRPLEHSRRLCSRSRRSLRTTVYTIRCRFSTCTLRRWCCRVLCRISAQSQDRRMWLIGKRSRYMIHSMRTQISIM
jgi:hypothetical protein